jgi:hypothetical protein
MDNRRVDRQDRIHTVVSGVFYTGLGDEFDGDKVQTYRPDCLDILPGDTAHFRLEKSGECVTQVNRRWTAWPRIHGLEGRSAEQGLVVSC